MDQRISMETLSRLPIKDSEKETFLKRVQAQETPLWEHWEEFVEDYLDRGGSEKTIGAIRSFIAFLLRNTNLTSLEDCNKAVLFSKALKEIKNARGFKNATYNKYKGCLNTYFRWLQDMEYIERNNLHKVRKFKEDSVEVYSLNSEQIDQIFLYIYEQNQIPFVKRRNMLFFDLLRTTAARRCELLDLQTKDIFYQRGNRKEKGGWKLRLHHAKQKGSIDYLNLPDWAGDSYEAYMEVRNKTRLNEKYLFVSQSKRDTGLTEKGVIYFLEEVERALGYKITSKAFRTHVATRLMEEGMSIQEVSFYLGHKRISTTLRYIKKTPLFHKRCSDVMAKQLSASDLKVRNYIPAKC